MRRDVARILLLAAVLGIVGAVVATGWWPDVKYAGVDCGSAVNGRSFGEFETLDLSVAERTKLDDGIAGCRHERRDRWIAVAGIAAVSCFAFAGAYLLYEPRRVMSDISDGPSASR